MLGPPGERRFTQRLALRLPVPAPRGGARLSRRCPGRGRAGCRCPDRPVPPGRSRSARSRSTSTFSRMREGVTDFGMTTLPSWRCQRSTTCAGVRPCRSAMAAITGLSSRPLPWPSGDHASVAMPCSACRARSSACGSCGCSSIWFTAGTVGALGDHAAQVRRLEVGHADRAGPAVGGDLLQRPPGLRIRVASRLRPVDQVQVDVVQAAACPARCRRRAAPSRSPGRSSTAWW